MATERFSIEWQAPEFEYRDKGVSWYWLSVIIAVVLLAISVWQKNFLFSVFVVLAEVMILVWAKQKPRTVKFTVDDKGLTINGQKFYPYSAIEAFGTTIGTGNEFSEIKFLPRQGLRAIIRVKIPARRLSEIEQALLPMLKKTDIDESFLDSLEKFIGF